MRRTAVQAIAQGWNDDPDTLPWLKDRALNDQNEYVRRAAVEAIAQGWKDDPDTLPWLKDRALNDQNWDVKKIGKLTLAKLRWKVSSKIIAIALKH